MLLRTAEDPSIGQRGILASGRPYPSIWYGCQAIRIFMVTQPRVSIMENLRGRNERRMDLGEALLLPYWFARQKVLTAMELAELGRPTVSVKFADAEMLLVKEGPVKNSP